MNIQKTTEARVRITALLLAAVSLFVLAGCGTDAPFGTTITAEAFGVPVILNPVTTPTVTSPTTKTQSYRVFVADSTGLPLNDIDVHFLGQFTNGQNINFGGGALGTAPVTLTTTKKTDRFGYMLFDVSVPYYALTPIHVPYNQNVVPSSTGGTLADGTYCYTITAKDYAGETEATASMTAVVSGATDSVTLISTGSVAISWAAVPGATSYMVYGRTCGGEGAMIELLNPTGDPLTMTDTGAWPVTATPPPGINTTGLSLNSVIGTAQVSSGAALATFSISF